MGEKDGMTPAVVLIVEDDPNIADLLEVYLRQSGALSFVYTMTARAFRPTTYPTCSSGCTPPSTAPTTGSRVPGWGWP